MSHVKVYKSTRMKGVAGFVGCAAFAYAGTFIISQRPLVGWATVLFFGACALIGLVSLVTGGSLLRLGPKGFEISSRFKCTRFRWDEIEALEVAKIKHTRVIAIKYLPGKGSNSASRALTGMDAAIGNAYNVSLQQLCDTMNDWRSRYVDAVRSRQTSFPQAAPIHAPPVTVHDSRMNAANPARPFVLALGAAFLVLVLNIVVRLMLKIEGMPVTMGIAFGVGGLVSIWFLKYVKRPPTPQEKSRFLWSYSALIVIPYLSLFALGSIRAGGVNGAALVILALHSLAYPAAAQMFLSEKRFNAMLGKRA